MGKGDSKTRRGKLFTGSYGVLRPRKKKRSFSVVNTTKKPVTRPEKAKAPPTTKTEPVAETEPTPKTEPVAETEQSPETEPVIEEVKPETKKPATKKPAAKKEPAGKKQTEKEPPEEESAKAGSPEDKSSK